MTSGPEWYWYVVAAVVAALFLAYFIWIGRTLFSSFRRVVEFIQNWPQMRRAMTEIEARAGGRFPFWYRAIRVFLILSMIGLMAFLLWRKFS